MTAEKLIRISAPLVLVALFLVGATCDKSPGMASATSPLAQTTVTNVSVIGPNQIKITADGGLKGYPFSLTDPLRIGIDLKNTAYSESQPAPISGGGVIDRVEVTTNTRFRQPLVRVTAYLRGDATYKMDTQGNEIILTLTPAAGSDTGSYDENQEIYDETMREMDRVLTGTPPSAYDPSADVAYMDDNYSQFSPPPYAITPTPPPNSDGSASAVGDIFYRTIRNGIQIMIYTNGDVRNYIDYDSFSPSRVTVELPGVTSVTPQRSYRVNWAGVSSVSLTRKKYDTAVAVNFNRPLPAYDINQTSSGIVITVFEHEYIAGGVKHSTYVTNQGDTLRRIAQQYYGNGDAWPRIWAANRGLFTRRETSAIRGDEGDVPLGGGIMLKIPTR